MNAAEREQLLAGMDEETKASFELAWRLQEEEDAWVLELHAAHARAAPAAAAQGPEDAESIALAIRLQQEDDEQALRDALGVQEGEEEDPGSPSQYSYEQLMRLSQTVGEVSKGASAEQITGLPIMTYAEAQKDSRVLLGEQVI